MIPQKCISWLESQYKKAESYQSGKGIRFELTLEEYLALWSAHRLKKLAKLIDQGQIVQYQRHRLFAWVLSWTSKKARERGVMNKDTARILLRRESEKRFYIQKGEKQSESAKAKIGAANKGKAISAEHRASISRARKGQPQTAEQIKARVAATKATKARKAAERQAQLQQTEQPAGATCSVSPPSTSSDAALAFSLVTQPEVSTSPVDASSVAMKRMAAAWHVPSSAVVSKLH